VTDYFEIDFLDVEAKKSGDAITIRYQVGNYWYVHVVDGGFQETGDSVVAHIRKYYGNPSHINHVVLTHSDGDHAGGLRSVLERYKVETLWMLRPWAYASDLLRRFPGVSSAANLERILKDAYPNIAALEEIALTRGIPIAEPFQGAQIGAFFVMAPSRNRYLDLIARSECTPASDAKGLLWSLSSILRTSIGYANVMARAVWGQETFSPQGVSAENEMSVVQYARIADTTILLTADAGREALDEVITYAPRVGLLLPGIDRFQVPHHGSRRNVSTDILDRILGPRLSSPVASGQERFTALISSAKQDQAHPRKAVVRAMIHRGARVIATEGMSRYTYRNVPLRPGWVAADSLPYPDDEETD
jgi:beta-lactamase superfamily II metal-dependent hydrolase